MLSNTPGNSKTDAPDDIAEILPETDIGDIVAQKPGGQQRAEHQRRQRDLDEEGRHDADGAQRDERSDRIGAQGAAGDQEAAQREEGRHQAHQEDAVQPFPVPARIGARDPARMYRQDGQGQDQAHRIEAGAFTAVPVQDIGSARKGTVVPDHASPGCGTASCAGVDMDRRPGRFQ
ncbi:hypothetical protein [Bosea sp. UC22_33]|uniref:hypothetical protein n=1 Tax=Bosea sp. UC22_33 TaxID=3350165 RepID=UPI003670000E